MPSITVPAGYSYVLASATASVWLNFWQMMRVGAARKRSGIKYPQLYAEKSEMQTNPEANRFNCVQRAHQNTLEQVPYFIFTTLFAGLRYPTAAASLAGLWLVGRVLYTIGYSTGDADKRNTRGGIVGMIGLFGLMLTSSYSAYEFVAESL